MHLSTRENILFEKNKCSRCFKLGILQQISNNLFGRPRLYLVVKSFININFSSSKYRSVDCDTDSLGTLWKRHLLSVKEREEERKNVIVESRVSSKTVKINFD